MTRRSGVERRVERYDFVLAKKYGIRRSGSMRRLGEPERRKGGEITTAPGGFFSFNNAQYYIDRRAQNAAAPRQELEKQAPVPMGDSDATAPDWLPHDGGECPVAPDTLVFIKFLAGDTRNDAVAAKDLIWSHSGEEDDIIAYRLAAPPVSTAEQTPIEPLLHAEWRVSKSGYTIRTGWNDDKKIIAHYPYSPDTPIEPSFTRWLEIAHHICDLHNATLVPPVETDAE